jgi:hypothetical protein
MRPASARLVRLGPTDDRWLDHRAGAEPRHIPSNIVKIVNQDLGSLPGAGRRRLSYLAPGQLKWQGLRSGSGVGSYRVRHGGPGRTRHRPSVGDAYDALMETINGLCKAECIRTTLFHDGPNRTLQLVRPDTAGSAD